MRTFYGTKLSDNMSETPEGYLICHDVPIARTGKQVYWGREFGRMDLDQVEIDRPESEVFKPATIASFEGKPFTNNHPFKLLDLDDALIYEKGHVQNIRREGDFIIGDILVKDKQTIDDIRRGKREISAGYDCDIIETEDGFIQCNIVGNHVALVEQGRAGEQVSIKDEDTKTTKGVKVKDATKDATKDNKSIIGKLLKTFAMDAEPEEMVEAVNTLKDRCAKDESPEEQEMENAILKELKEKIDTIEERINGLEARKPEADEEPENELEKLEKEVTDEEVDKRDIIRQIMAIAGKNEDNEDVRTIAKLAEKLAYDNSEAGVHDDNFANDPKIIEAYAEKAQQDEAPDEEKSDDGLKKEVADAKQVIAGIQDSAVRRQVADSFAKIIRGKMKSGEAYKKALYASKMHTQDSFKTVDVNAAFKKIREDRFRK